MGVRLAHPSVIYTDLVQAIEKSTPPSNDAADPQGDSSPG